MNLNNQEPQAQQSETDDEPKQPTNKGRFIFPRQQGLGVVMVQPTPTAHHMAKIIRLPQR